jgi:hypothetical protein
MTVRQRCEPRFGPIRPVPPTPVLDYFPRAGSWAIERIGDDGAYPNGGLWRFEAGPMAVVVKRCGAAYLGEDVVWRCRSHPKDPQWWGREAAFYESDLAVNGWSSGARAVRCYAIDDHDGCRDLWLEALEVPALSLSAFERASAGLAQWQVANAATSHDWLSRDWIPTHIARHALDNPRTLAHPGWEPALARGLHPGVRDAVAVRVTDPEVARRRLSGFPQTLTHFDFHHANVGTVGAEVAIIDWAYVGWGPIGHDVGHLAVDCSSGLGLPLPEVWEALETAYCHALVDAGWVGDLAVVRRSIATSNGLRLGWTIDHLLNTADRMPDDALQALSDQLRFLTDLADI